MSSVVFYELWTDGSCRTSTSEGGWAFILLAKRDGRILRELERSGYEKDVTNNQMELWAVAEGISALHSPVVAPSSLTIYTDSRYITDAFNLGWLSAWKLNGWRLRDAQGNYRELANLYFWKVLDRLAKPHNICWRHVRGHTKVHYNERAHKLAQQASRSEGRI